MNTINKRFLEALRASLRKENIDWNDMSEDDWKALYQLAKYQGVLPLIYQATYNCASAKKHEELTKSYFRVVSEQVAIQVIKTADFLGIYQKLCEQGVKPLLVKGLICRNLYPNPDHRPSKDEDVFILPEQFEVCHREFMDYDMQLLDEDEDVLASSEVSYGKFPTLLYVELHKSLFPPVSDAYGNLNRFFAGVHERAVQETIQGVPIYTLNYTEHLLYLVCHAFKHFLGSGVGIRQVCDITLFANQYGKEIDWEILMKQCKEIAADKFMATLFRIGETYLTFEPEKACYPNTFRELAIDETDLINDMLDGGVLGDVSLSRIHSGNITLHAMSANKKGKESKGMVLKSIFPSRTYLVKWYKYLEKYPFLLPVAWVSRIFGYLRKIDKLRNNPVETVHVGTQRVKLLRKYGVLR